MPTATPSTPILDLYRDLATGYDASTQRFDDTRRDVIAALRLQPGDTVLDMGCGTGRCFGFVQDAVGPGGRLVGADQSPEMLARARERCDRHGWGNVELVEGPADHVVVPPGVQAVLLCATHDILRSPRALDHLFAQVAPGTRVAASGGKLPPPWLAALAPFVLELHRPYVSSFEGFAAPWSHLADRLGAFDVRDVAAGTGFIATGVVQ